MIRTERLAKLAEHFDERFKSELDYGRAMAQLEQKGGDVPNRTCRACQARSFLHGVNLCSECLFIVSETLAAQAVEKVAGWRPIESAPKDGTPVLVVENIDGRQVVGEAYCCHDDESFYWAQESPHDYPEPDKIFPTHWMPLPSPPVRASSQDGGDR
jgi:hypothetical protein